MNDVNVGMGTHSFPSFAPTQPSSGKGQETQKQPRARPTEGRRKSRKPVAAIDQLKGYHRSDGVLGKYRFALTFLPLKSGAY